MGSTPGVSELLGQVGSDQYGMVRGRCAEAGINGASVVAEAYESLRNLQIDTGAWCYENYSKQGSDSYAVIESEATGLSKPCITWCINHYLGLNRDPRVIEAAVAALREYGTGCGTSAMSGGHNTLHKQLERKLAAVLGKEAALLFPTGYSANVGAISALGKIGKTAMFVDRECHASIIDGIKLGGAKLIPFRHNNVGDLQRKLAAYAKDYDNVVVIVESVYSMSGDEAPIQEILALKQKTPFYFFVDEAHGFGLYDVGGLCKKLGVSDQVDFIMTTLSKSTASIGGVVATSRDFVSLMQAEANAYLFQAALTPPDAAAILKALEIIESEPEIVESLWEKTRYFRAELRKRGFDIGNGTSPIIPLFVRDSATLFEMGRDLLENGIFTTSVTYPVVKHTEVRFRFILNNSHTYEQINQTLDVLSMLGEKHAINTDKSEE